MFPELSYMAQRPCKISLTYVHPFSILKFIPSYIKPERTAYGWVMLC